MIFARPRTAPSTRRNKDTVLLRHDGRGRRATRLGRLYALDLTGKDSTGPAKLTVTYNADQVIAARRRHRHQPGQHRREPRLPDDQRGRNGDEPRRRWRASSATARSGASTSTRTASTSRRALRIAELNPPGRDRVPGRPRRLGDERDHRRDGPVRRQDTWLFDVQAHPPTAAPKPNTVEDGQLLLLVGPDDKGKEDDDDDDD